jgi:endonuclease I
MRFVHLTLFVVFLAGSRLSAQGFESVFPGLSGDDLIDSVASHYRPAIVLDYTNSRDTLYSRILAIDDDSVRCIYSGHILYLDPTQDPTQYVYQNGGSNGMNAEHAYPQSKGAADGNARSDMHHLYPVRILVNEARGDFPYAEIPDAQTQKWFIGNQVQTSIPTVNIQGYAEFKTGAFEPRESAKGDLARSVFYFYTMYRTQANLADPNYFELQRTTLCNWAQQDPADSVELRKTWRIAPYQDGKPNPFVIDCTLASRCWCPGVPPGCMLDTDAPFSAPEMALKVWPNPVNDLLHFEFESDGPVTIRLLDVLGSFVMPVGAGKGSGSFSVKNLPGGLYILEVSTKNSVARQIVLVQ